VRAHEPAGKLRRSDGWSTIEVLALLGFAAILAGAAAPSLRGALATLHLRAATLQLAAALTRGRIAAISEGRSWQVRVVSGDAYTIGPTGEAPLQEKLPGGARFASATSGGTVQFSPSGNAENATFTLELTPASGRVVVNQRGRVTVSGG
jgi:Tfp pilus assembly protein FimT